MQLSRFLNNERLFKVLSYFETTLWKSVEVRRPKVRRIVENICISSSFLNLSCWLESIRPGSTWFSKVFSLHNFLERKNEHNFFNKSKILGNQKFHTMGIRELKPNCVQSPEFCEKIPDFTQNVRNSTFCVES